MLNEFNQSFITAADGEVIMHKRAAEHESRRYIDLQNQLVQSRMSINTKAKAELEIVRMKQKVEELEDEMKL